MRQMNQLTPRFSLYFSSKYNRHVYSESAISRAEIVVESLFLWICTRGWRWQTSAAYYNSPKSSIEYDIRRPCGHISTIVNTHFCMIVVGLRTRMHRDDVCFKWRERQRLICSSSLIRTPFRLYTGKLLSFDSNCVPQI